MVGTIQFGELIQFIQNFADLARPLVPGDRDGQVEAGIVHSTACYMQGKP